MCSGLCDKLYYSCLCYLVLKKIDYKYNDYVSAYSEKLVIDTDPGADDAAAILLILSMSARNYTNYEVVGITCVYGNTFEDLAEKNVLKILTVANLPDIPVYGGAQKPLMRNYTAENYFGEDGFGDFEFKDEILGEVDRSTHAAVALVKLARRYPRELSVLALGPLTNIAIAMTLDPEFAKNVKRFFIMGGSVSGVGNKSPGVEFNFGADPESNHIVLSVSKNTPHLLLPWETIFGSNITKEWRTKELGLINSSFVEFLNKVESKVLGYDNPGWNSADALMAAVMLRPNLVRRLTTVHVAPVIDGSARGSLLIDYTNTTGQPGNVEIIQEVNTEEFKQMLKEFLS
ncbi:hypothetical protein KQX54_020888 [Cotesia glomerata]|uniref:Inosine/uridine-preferring nucleoside hydrolase domain-containing protein n=1 Tax=Cotesia glomerata TaxID=32391 RepID=A0AAV7IDJ3_COTGL|nr:hypothetical protein KQX54_020888 [Cotesia glomerata]